MAFQPGVFGPSQTDAPTAASEPAVTKQPWSPKAGRRPGGVVVGIATAVADSAEGPGFAISIDAAADLIRTRPPVVRELTGRPDGPGDARPGLSSGSQEPA